MSSLVKGSLIGGLVIYSLTGSLVKKCICTSVRKSLISSFLDSDSYVIGDTNAGKLMMVGMVLVNGLALMVEETQESQDGQEVGMWQ